MGGGLRPPGRRDGTRRSSGGPGREPRAKAFFATLNSVNRYAILFRIQTVKKAETREKKIQQLVKMLEEQKKIHP